ncbi:MAG: hydroxyacylglutathione hydrolase, partial [Pseudomonadota bacterium]
MIQVINIPAFADNYIWLITNEERKFAVIVDPGDADPVLAELAQRQI